MHKNKAILEFITLLSVLKTCWFELRSAFISPLGRYVDGVETVNFA